MNNVGKNRDYKLVITLKIFLVLEPNYSGRKNFSENLWAEQMRKTQILINKLI